MGDNYADGGKRKSKNDKRAKARYNRYKRGGSKRTVKLPQRGQVSIFVIIAIVIVGVVVLLFALNKGGGDGLGDLDDVSVVVVSCLDSVVEEGLFELGANGGLGVDVGEVEENIGNHVIGNLDVCLNGFSDLKAKGYGVDEGEMDVDVEVGEKVVVELSYPLTVSYGDDSYRVEIYPKREYGVKLGYMLGVARDVNKLDKDSADLGYLTDLEVDVDVGFKNKSVEYKLYDDDFVRDGERFVYVFEVEGGE